MEKEANERVAETAFFKDSEESRVQGELSANGGGKCVEEGQANVEGKFLG
jgi:hypothetical protein